MLRTIFADLWDDRVRTALVALGVLWGTLGLASLLAFGGEMIRATRGTMHSFGEDILRVSGAATTRPWRGLSGGRSVSLEVDDAEALASLPEVRDAVVEFSVWGQRVRAGDARHTGTLVGTGPAFEALRSRRAMPGGRFLSRRDVEEQRNVAYVGANAARTLFGDADAVGRTVEILDAPFVVVGVSPDLVQISSYNGDDRDKVYVPSTTLAALTGRRSPSFLIA
ncbi:MAG: ABC transporter permease, partial [Planctomycetota bacterium]